MSRATLLGQVPELIIHCADHYISDFKMSSYRSLHVQRYLQGLQWSKLCYMREMLYIKCPVNCCTRSELKFLLYCILHGIFGNKIYIGESQVLLLFISCFYFMSHFSSKSKAEFYFFLLLKSLTWLCFFYLISDMSV